MTNLYGGIENAFQLLNGDGSEPLVSMIIHLTDGQPTAGVEDPGMILDGIANMNIEKGILQCYHTLV